MMQIVSVEDVQEHLDWRRGINRLSLKEISWMLDGKKLKIDQKVIDEFAYTGLNNIDFISTGYWKRGVNKEVLEAAGLSADER